MTKNVDSVHNKITCHACPGEASEKVINVGVVERPLLIVVTVASLSHKTTICLRDHLLPHNKEATTIGYNSNTAVDLQSGGKASISLGQASENHSPLKNPPKPTEGAASVKNSVEADVSDTSLQRRNIIEI